MKTLLLSLTLAAVGVSTVHAQLYQPAITNGAILGGIAGALVGGHNHDRWGEGALIGTVAGALLGATVEPPRAVVYQQPPVTVVQSAAAVPMAPTVPNAPVVMQASPQVVYVPAYQPAQVVYVQPAPVVYVAAPYFGYGGGVRYYYGRPGYRHW
jgi:hypothetical protein